MALCTWDLCNVSKPHSQPSCAPSIKSLTFPCCRNTCYLKNQCMHSHICVCVCLCEHRSACVHMSVHIKLGRCVKARGWLVGVSSFLSSCNLGIKPWSDLAASFFFFLFAWPSHWPSVFWTTVSTFPPFPGTHNFSGQPCFRIYCSH